jgi:type I restriction enzyme S subunit
MLAFGDILTEEHRFIDVLDEIDYACGGVRLHGRGAFIREYKTGAEIRKKFVQHVAKAGDVVYSTLFAKSGAFAVVEDDVDGAVLSEKFPTYRLVDDRVSLDYLKWLFRSEQVTHLAAEQVTGVAAFSLSHLSKSKFLRLMIPVPSPERQQEVVRICEEVFRRAASVEAPLSANAKLLNHMVAAGAQRLMEAMPHATLGTLGAYVLRGVDIVENEQYSQITVAMGHKGLRLRRICDGSQIRSPGQCLVRQGDILFSRIDIRQGAIGIVPASLDGGVVTRDFPVFRLSDTNDQALRFLTYAFRSTSFMLQVQAASRGTTGRKKMKRDIFLNLMVAWPSPGEQRVAVEKLSTIEGHSLALAKNLAAQQVAFEAIAGSVAATLFGRDAGLLPAAA